MSDVPNHPDVSSGKGGQRVKPTQTMAIPKIALCRGLGWPNLPISRDIQAMALQVEFAMSE